MRETKTVARAEFAQHWTLVFAAALGLSFTSVMAAGAGLFMEPLSTEFGWSRSLVSSGLAITSITTFFLSPLFGMLIDRWGTRRLALPGLTLMMFSVISLSLLNGSLVQWFVIWTVYAIAALASKSTVWTAAVSSVFDAGRGLALGLTLCGAAVAQALTPPIANFLIEDYGWRAAFFWLGLGWGSVAIILCTVWLIDGYVISSRQRTSTKVERSPKGPLLDVPGLSIAQAWHSQPLWRIAISTFLMMLITIALLVHQVPILMEAGVSRANAALFASIFGIAGIIGKLVTGFLLDKYAARWIGGVTIASTSLAFLLLLIPSRTPVIIIAAIFVAGYAAGTKLQFAGYLTAAYGGMRNFGVIFGTMASLIAAGSGLGPLFAGMVYDAFNSYDPFLWFGVFGTIFSATLLFGLGTYPHWESPEMGAPAAV